MTFLALGDSYTIGEGIDPSEAWPFQLAEKLRQRLHGVPIDPVRIIARTGWRTDELLAAINRENPQPTFDLVSLSIGVNNQYQGQPAESYISEFEPLLEKAIDLARGKPDHVMVLSIPDYGSTPFGASARPKISSAIDAYNELNRVVSGRKAVRYYDITDLTRRGSADPNLIAGDGLHPSTAQYGLWVDRIVSDPSLITMIKELAQ